ncbi:MAG: hypothetical protein QNJ22_06065 [Desulfosarcinaceae bacterium]|nr:hypothetical protein [Desulfosarcinaceae bacterium]
MRAKAIVGRFLVVIASVMALMVPWAGFAADGELLWPDDLEIEDPQILLSDNAGGAIVVWTTNGYPDEIRAQRYDDDGKPVWGTNGKLVSDTTDAAFAAATEDMFGGIVVTYASGAHFYAQRLNASGNKQWNGGKGVIVLAGVNPSEDPIITPDGAGGAYIGYERKLNHVQNNGKVGNTKGYEYVMSEGVERFSMVYDGQRSLGRYPDFHWIPGGVFLVWFSSSTLKIHAQHVLGGPRWGDTATMRGVIVSSAYTHVSISHNRLYRVIADGSGGAIVGWAGWKGYPLNSGQIRAQRLDANGAPLWTTDGVAVVDSSLTGGDSIVWWQQLMPPEVVSDGMGGAILTWMDMRNTHNYPGDTDIYCQRVAANGNTQWKYNGVWVTWPGDTAGGNPPNSGTEKNPVMVADGSGGAVIAAQDYYKSQNLFANRIASDGTTLWTRWLVWDDYNTGYADQYWPQIVFDAGGTSAPSAIVAWYESGGTVGDSAQKIEIDDAPPTNDAISAADPLPMCGSTPCPVSGSLYWASNDGETTCASYGGQPDVWYRYTAPSDGTLKVNTCGSNDMFGADAGLDTVLSIHSGKPGTAKNTLQCNDDASGGACAGADGGNVIRDSAVTHQMLSGETVYIRVSRYSPWSNGRFKLGWSYTAK